MTGDVCLHNRNELLAWLEADRLAAERLSDLQLVLAAYHRWEDSCCEYLLGEFAFVVWDSRRRRLFCGRDHVGARPFFYWQRSSRFGASGDIWRLLRIPGVPRELNRQKLAGMVVPGGIGAYPEDTFHAGIRSLPAGCCLTIDERGTRKRRYWDIAINDALVPRRPEAAFEALRELLFEAVRCRLPETGPVAVELSGGLDSSAVTAIAASCLARKGRSLDALSVVLPHAYAGPLSDEREFIDLFGTDENIRIHYVTAEGRGPFDSLNSAARFVATPHISSRFYLYECIEEAAKTAGANLILQGLLGEFGATCPGLTWFAELAVRFRWLTLARQLGQVRRVQKRSPIRFLGGRLLEVLPRSPANSVENVFLTPEYAADRSVVRPTPAPRWPQQENQAGLLRRYLRTMNRLPGDSLTGLTRRSQPLGDKRILEFCVSAPPELKVRDGYWRYLVRGALKGVLPEKIRWRTSKQPFSPDYFVRYNSQLALARDYLAGIGPGDPVRSVVDIDRLTRLVRPVHSPALEQAENARDIVPANLYTIAFLRQFPEFRA